MKNYKEIIFPAVVAVMMVSPSFLVSEASVNQITRAPAQTVPVSSELEGAPESDLIYSNITLDKKEDLTSEEEKKDEEEVIAEDENKDEEEVIAEEENKDEEEVIAEEEKKDEEKVIAEEEKKDEEEVIAKDESKKVAPTLEELTGLVCRGQQQLERITTSIDGLLQNMKAQMEMMQTFTNLMMMNQFASNMNSGYGQNLFAQTNPMISSFESFLYGQRMGNLMSIFNPLTSASQFGFNTQQPIGPIYNYNVTGDFYGTGYSAPTQQLPQSFGFGGMGQQQVPFGNSIQMMQPSSNLIQNAIL